MTEQIRAISEVERALAPLDGALEDARSPAEIAAARAKGVIRLRAFVANVPRERAKTERRRFIRNLTWGISAAAGIALAVGVLHHFRAEAPHPIGGDTLRLAAITGRVTYRQGGGDRSLNAGEQAGIAIRGDVLTGDGDSARIETAQGLEIDIAPRSEMSLGDLTSASMIQLRDGKVSCHVPHLAAGASFAVVTRDARTVVHGTRFSVETPPSAPESALVRRTTCVQVTEGIVSVEHEGGTTWLHAGEAWGCTDPSPPATVASAPAPGASRPAAGERASLPATGDAVGKPSPGTLVQQTRLLQSALAAERRGDRARAARDLRTLLTRYPDSPLAADARASLARVTDAVP